MIAMAYFQEEESYGELKIYPQGIPMLQKEELFFWWVLSLLILTIHVSPIGKDIFSVVLLLFQAQGAYDAHTHKEDDQQQSQTSTNHHSNDQGGTLGLLNRPQRCGLSCIIKITSLWVKENGPYQ